MPVAVFLFVVGNAFILTGLLTGHAWAYALSVALNVAAGIAAILSDTKH